MRHMRRAVSRDTRWRRTSSSGVGTASVSAQCAAIATHTPSGTRVECSAVPVNAENCRRHDPHFQTRRGDLAPVRVRRVRPSAGASR